MNRLGRFLMFYELLGPLFTSFPEDLLSNLTQGCRFWDVGIKTFWKKDQIPLV